MLDISTILTTCLNLLCIISSRVEILGQKLVDKGHTFAKKWLKRITKGKFTYSGEGASYYHHRFPPAIIELNPINFQIFC